MCKPSDYSSFVGRQCLSSFAVWRVVGCENLFSRCLVSSNLCKVSANERNENLFSDCRTPPNLCKVSASERNENLFSYCRMPPNLCKVSANERSENLFSYCRMPPNLCKSTQIMIETAILRALFISCYHFYAYLCTKVLISEYKEKICLRMIFNSTTRTTKIPTWNCVPKDL